MAGSGSAVRAFAIGVLVTLVSGCAPHAVRRPRGPGIYHSVQRGENLFRIGKAYGVDHRELANLNGIDDASRIEVGQRIFIPGASRTLPVEIIAPRATEERPPEPAELAEATRAQPF